MKIQQVTTGGLILRKDGKFLIVKRSEQEEFMPSYWELPGGGAEYGETPQEAMKREIKEECGLNIVVYVPLAIGQYFIKEIQHVEIVFLCIINGKDTVQLSSEHSASAWISVSELSKYKMSSFVEKLIKDATADLDYWIKKHES